MEKEIKSKAIELGDEELENVAGGRAIVYFSISRKTFSCNRSGINASELYDNLFKKNTCDRDDKIDESKPKSCENCIYYVPWGYTSEENLKKMDDGAYDVKVYDK